MIFCSTAATFCFVATTASLFTLMLSMPARTRNSAKSGRFDGTFPADADGSAVFVSNSD